MKEVPIWEKTNLTLEEAAAYSGIGINKLREITNNDRCDFVLCNVVLHPEFVEGKYALYTRPQDGFIDAGSGGGIGWALGQRRIRG